MTQQNKPPLPAPAQHPSTLEGLVRAIADRQLATDRKVDAIADDVADIKGHLIATKSQARQTSQNDMRQDAAIARIDGKLDRLLSIGERLDKVAANPMVRRVAYALGLAFLAWAATKGIKVLP